MKPDLIQLLKQAFHHLELFSVPRVGTFRKSYRPATVSHQDGVLLPPAEVFAFEEGEKHIGKLEAFFLKKFNLSSTEAVEWVRRLSILMLIDLEVKDKFTIPGIGELVKAPGEGLRLEWSGSSLGQWFGLKNVGYSLGESYKTATLQEKEAAAEQRIQEETLLVEPVEPVRQTRIWPILIVAILVLAVGSLAIFRHQLTDWAEDVGLIADSNTNADPDKGAGNIAALDPDANTKLDDSIPPPPETNDTQPDMVRSTVVETSTDADLTGMTVEVERGQHYLIASACREGGNALAFVNDLKAKGIDATILEPRVDGALFKISVFHAGSKDKVIAKMVEFKDSIDGTTWIYSP